MPSDRITLLKQDGFWCCQFHGEMAAEVRELFGVEVIPSPFRDSVPASEVVPTIEARNPGVLVEVQA